jgi:hypothetical protein
VTRSIFAWIAFNRDGFADNVSWRQAQKYQQKNYNISCSANGAKLLILC